MQRIYATSRAQPRRSVLPKPRLGWYVLVALGLGMLALGLHGYARQLAHGDVVTGMRDPGRGGAAWGLYISLYVYLVGISLSALHWERWLIQIRPLLVLFAAAAIVWGVDAAAERLGWSRRGRAVALALAVAVVSAGPAALFAEASLTQARPSCISTPSTGSCELVSVVRSR